MGGRIMRKVKFLFVMLIGILLVPYTVFAADDTSSDKKVNVYFFYGNGCGYCAKAEEFFDSLKEDFGD